MMATELLVPDRYDVLQRKAPNQMAEIVHPVDDALNFIDELHSDMRASCRGSFLIFRGESGAGKSTFLHTIGLFREKVESFTISKADDLVFELSKVKESVSDLRIIVLEGREALTDVSKEILEKYIHSINAFIRTPSGENTIVAWPVNRDDLASRLAELSVELGAEAMVGINNPIYVFNGPSKDDFIQIANSTISVLNEGANIHDLGISDSLTQEIISQSNTIGNFLARIRAELLKNKKTLQQLTKKEKCRVWTIVLAGNDPDADVDGLTRGTFYAADVDRMMAVTNANIVEELKKYPEKLGILGTFFDARIIHLPMIPTLSAVRSYADKGLKDKMKALQMIISPDKEVIERLSETNLVHSFQNLPIRARKVGQKPGSNTVTAFEKLARIASDNDQILNKCIAEALKAMQVITDYKLEQNFGSGLTRRTDILVQTANGPIRLEMMWRKKTGRAEISNYVLTKLYNYGKAIGYL